tara:strand:+ start:428 stop:793 length:366 start_codon:yes stop_codon:yes gene_type:complete
MKRNGSIKNAGRVSKWLYQEFKSLYEETINSLVHEARRSRFVADRLVERGFAEITTDHPSSPTVKITNEGVRYCITNYGIKDCPCSQCLDVKNLSGDLNVVGSFWDWGVIDDFGEVYLRKK